MTEQEILLICGMAETGQAQFKERANGRYDIDCGVVAFKGFCGGRLVFGINDKMGGGNTLSYMELQEITNLLKSIASGNVQTAGGAVVVMTILEGKNKPYYDNNGIIWVKNDSDKRKVFDNSELADMMGYCGRYDVDEEAVRAASFDNTTFSDCIFDHDDINGFRHATDLRYIRFRNYLDQVRGWRNDEAHSAPEILDAELREAVHILVTMYVYVIARSITDLEMNGF